MKITKQQEDVLLEEFEQFLAGQMKVIQCLNETSNIILKYISNYPMDKTKEDVHAKDEDKCTKGR